MRTLTTVMLSVFLISASLSFKNDIIDNSTIHWYSLEEAVEMQHENPKKIFIDVYTDWCGWCKVMDKKTFTDEAVTTYMNENFYAVKFDAEQKESIVFKEKEYKYISRGTKGINELALDLLDMQPSYPAFVILDAEKEKLGMFKGYSPPDAFIAKVDKLLASEN